MTATMGRESVDALTPLRRRGAAPLLVGLLGFIISMIGITTPGLWYDEAATVISATRSWSQLWAEIGNVDAVHALYYAGMHVIFDLVGYTPLSLRIPSAIAVGVAAAFVLILGRQLDRPRLAVIAAIAFCLIPRVTWMGTEGRSYALTAALAVIITVALMRAVRSGSRGAWVVYGLLSLLSIVVFLYLALVVVAHAVTMALFLRDRTRGSRLTAQSWLVTAVVAGALSVPFALEVISQSGQVAWIRPLGLNTIEGVLRGQWFFGSDLFAVVAWGFIILGVVMLVRTLRRARDGDIAPERATARTFLALVLPAMLVPTIALLLISTVHQSIYQPRYLTMCAPFVALAIAAGIDAIRWRPAAVVSLALLVTLAVPQIIAQRLPEAKERSSWPKVAALIAAERASDGAGSTTAMIYGELFGHPKATTRVIAYSYPQAFVSTVDVTIRTPAAETAQLWETRAPIAESLEALKGTDVAYLIADKSGDIRPETTTALNSIGWHMTDQWSFTKINVVRYSRN